jgi:hypothetical protein
MNSTFKENFLEGKVAIVTGGATGILYGYFITIFNLN